MPQIKILNYNNTNVVTSGGTKFYPVTTSKGVYDTTTRTLYNVLHNTYNSNTVDKTTNGLYAWLEHLDDAVASCISTSQMTDILSRISTVSNAVSSLSTDVDQLSNDFSVLNIGLTNRVETFETNITNTVNRRTTFTYDIMPTLGSTNLVTSGGIYSYIRKLLNGRSDNEIQKVTNLDAYDAVDGEIVLYIGETTESYTTNSFYKYVVEVSGDSSTILCNGDYSNLTTNGHWELVETIVDGDDVDLSNYYTKTEVDTIIDGLVDKDTTYVGDGSTVFISPNNVISARDTTYTGDNTTIFIDSNNVIHALASSGGGVEPIIYTGGNNIYIEGTTINADLSNYYTTTQVDLLLQHLLDGIDIEPIEYEAGTNITINGTTINADIPETGISELVETGTGNAVTEISYNTSTRTLTSTKGETFLTNFSVTASVDDSTGTPSVTVTQGGSASLPTFDFEFHNLKGGNGAPGRDAANSDVYDCNVANKQQLEAAIRTSWIGYYIEVADADYTVALKEYLHSAATSETITIDGQTITPKKCKVRMHITQNFSLTPTDTYGLENCEIYGDCHTIDMSTSTKALKLNGRGCNIKNLQLILKSLENKIEIQAAGNSHSYYTFEDCQFNNAIQTDNTDRNLFKISVNSADTMDLKLRYCNYNTNNVTLSNTAYIPINFNDSKGPVILLLAYTLSMTETEGNQTETNKFKIRNYQGNDTSGKLRIFNDKSSPIYDNSGNAITTSTGNIIVKNLY